MHGGSDARRAGHGRRIFFMIFVFLLLAWQYALGERGALVDMYRDRWKDRDDFVAAYIYSCLCR